MHICAGSSEPLSRVISNQIAWNNVLQKDSLKHLAGSYMDWKSSLEVYEYTNRISDLCREYTQRISDLCREREREREREAKERESAFAQSDQRLYTVLIRKMCASCIVGRCKKLIKFLTTHCRSEVISNMRTVFQEGKIPWYFIWIIIYQQTIHMKCRSLFGFY